jgi:hypothetical protein
VVRVTSVDHRTTQSRIYIVNKKGGCERKGLVGVGWCKSVSETLFIYLLLDQQVIN